MRGWHPNNPGFAFGLAIKYPCQVLDMSCRKKLSYLIICSSKRKEKHICIFHKNSHSPIRCQLVFKLCPNPTHLAPGRERQIPKSAKQPIPHVISKVTHKGHFMTCRLQTGSCEETPLKGDIPAGLALCSIVLIRMISQTIPTFMPYDRLQVLLNNKMLKRQLTQFFIILYFCILVF